MRWADFRDVALTEEAPRSRWPAAEWRRMTTDAAAGRDEWVPAAETGLAGVPGPNCPA